MAKGEFPAFPLLPHESPIKDSRFLTLVLGVCLLGTFEIQYAYFLKKYLHSSIVYLHK